MFRFQDHIDTCLTTIGVQADSRLEKPMTCLLKILTSTLTLKLLTSNFSSPNLFYLLKFITQTLIISNSIVNVLIASGPSFQKDGQLSVNKN